MKAVCIGNSTYDITLPIAEFPKENLKYHTNSQVECGGGQASNGAYLLAKWGMDTTILSVIGDDYYADKIITEFKDVGVKTEYLEKRKNHNTSTSYILANTSNGSRTIITAKKDSIRKLNQDIDIKADLILVDGEHPETAEKVLLDNKNAISILDAGRLTDDVMHLGKLVTYVICAQTFAEEFADTKIDVNNMNTLITCYEKLKAYFKNNIIITLEENGSFTKIDDYELIPSIKVKAVDSTGAGDIFHGAFTYFIGHNYSLKDTIKYASITGALSVTKIGSRYSIPELSEVLDHDNLI